MLHDGEALGIETRRLALEDGRRLAHRPECKRGRGQEVLGLEEVPIVGVRVHGAGVDAREAGGAVVRARQWCHGPACRLTGCRDLDAVANVVEEVDEDVVPGRREAGEDAAFRGCEEHREVARAGEEAVEADGEKAPRGEGAPARLPVGARGDEEPAPMDGEARVGGDVDRDELPAPAEEPIVVEEVAAPGDELRLEAGREVRPGADGDIGRLALEHGGRLAERLAAPPELDDPGIPGVGHRAGAEVRRDEDLVRTGPGHLPLRFGERESALDEAPGDEVELADDHRIRPAAGEADEGPVVAGDEHRGAREHPPLAFGAAERVEVEHHLPGGRGLAVLLERGAPPDAPRVLPVLPEVVVAVTELPEMGDAVLGVERRPEAGAERVEPRLPRRERRVGGPVAFRDPRERVRPLHLLEPEVRVNVAQDVVRRRHVPSPALHQSRCGHPSPPAHCRPIQSGRAARSAPRFGSVTWALIRLRSEESPQETTSPSESTAQFSPVPPFPMWDWLRPGAPESRSGVSSSPFKALVPGTEPFRSPSSLHPDRPNLRAVTAGRNYCPAEAPTPDRNGSATRTRSSTSNPTSTSSCRLSRPSAKCRREYRVIQAIRV